MPRCQWIKEDGKRCVKSGKGTPALCIVHTRVANTSVVDGVLTAILNQSPVKKVVSKISKILDNVGTVVDKAAVGEFDTIIGAFKKHKVKFEVPVPSAPTDDPRAILGFKPGDKLTVDIIKQRRKDLAKKLHSDYGGSDMLMQKVNVACDALLKELKK